MNAWEHEPAADDAIVEIHKCALPREETGDSGRWQRFLIGFGNFYRLYIRGWTWDQIDRLREAKLREIESANFERTAAAMQKLAEAKKLDVEAESVYYGLERQRTTAASPMSSERMEPTEQQWNELRAAIELIRLKGGSVDFPGFERSSPSAAPPALSDQDVSG